MIPEQHTDAQCSFLNRMRQKALTKSIKKFWTKRKQLILLICQKQVDKTLRNPNLLAPPKFTRTEKIINLIKRSKNILIDKNENSIVDGTATGINVHIFLYDLQQPTKINN